MFAGAIFGFMEDIDEWKYKKAVNFKILLANFGVIVVVSFVCLNVEHFAPKLLFWCSDTTMGRGSPRCNSYTWGKVLKHVLKKTDSLQGKMKSLTDTGKRKK